MTIREYLEAYDMKPYQFAARFLFSKCSVYRWVTGYKPSLVSAQKIEKRTKGVITLKDLGYHGNCHTD